MVAGRIAFDFANTMADVVGKQHGVTKAELAGVDGKLRDGHTGLAQLRKAGKVAFFDLPYQKENIRQVKSLAAKVAGKFDAVVVLGIGGSALGTIALRTALCHAFHNELPAKSRKWPRLYVEDNVDPAHTKELFDIVNPKKTLFVVISKSGSTVETMSQLLLVRNLLGGHMKKNVIAITDKRKGCLRPIADAETLGSLDVPDGVGGRFSVLSPVGLLPAAVCGMDIDSLLAGAADADKKLCSSADIDANDAYKAAAIEYILYGKGNSLSVMMPYASSLRDVADWYCQLWGESLGKNDRVGPTPIKALGVTDQHSQVQLYREGPNDKVFTFLAVKQFKHSLKIPAGYKNVDALNYIGGHTFNQLLEYERIGTTLALTDACRPNYTITLPEVSAYTIGQLLHLLEVKTAISGQLYGIDAFNQPGVEAGKVLAYGLMGRKGFASARQWVKDKQAGKKVQSIDKLMKSLEGGG